MDEIMNFRKTFLYSILALIPYLSSAHFSLLPDNAPIEFLNSLNIGSQKAVISVPGKFELVSHDVMTNKQILAFVPDNQSKDKWTEHVSLNITQNTDESAALHIDNIRGYIQSNFPQSKVLDSSISRERNGVQRANISVLFTDEEGEVVVSAQYFSDESHLIGVEVSKTGAAPVFVTVTIARNDFI